jgi:hypothetical protein
LSSCLEEEDRVFWGLTDFFCLHWDLEETMANTSKGFALRAAIITLQIQKVWKK